MGETERERLRREWLVAEDALAAASDAHSKASTAFQLTRERFEDACVAALGAWKDYHACPVEVADRLRGAV